MHNAQVPLIVSNAGNDDLTGPQCSPWIMRSSFSNAQISREMGPMDGGPVATKDVFLMAFDYAAGHQAMEAFPWRLRRRRRHRDRRGVSAAG